MKSDCPKKAAGFTLLEVMIALSVFAVASIGLFKVGQQNVLNAARLEEKTIAHWVALNKMVEMQASGEWPNTGKQDSKAEMGNRDWEIEVTVENTQLKTLRKVDIRVGTKGEGLGSSFKSATVLTGFIGDKSL